MLFFGGFYHVAKGWVIVFKALFPAGKVPAVDEELDLSGIDMHNLPAHIAIIMDGNGRWAQARGKARTFGHQAGAETLKTIVRAANKLGIKAISAYAFSTENWKRPLAEVSFLMELISRYLASELEEFNANNVQVRFMGSRAGLPEAIRRQMDETIAATSGNTGLILNLAINYGSRREIVQAAQAVAAEVAAGRLQPADISEELLDRHMYTADLPAPDLLVRPGGDMRISNFMLWQIAYTEIWTTDVYWPDFTPANLLEAIREYQSRERRFGALGRKKQAGVAEQ